MNPIETGDLDADWLVDWDNVIMARIKAINDKALNTDPARAVKTAPM